MVATEQKNGFQNKLHEAFVQAQAKATARAKELEQEARKILETLGDRAQVEVSRLLQLAQSNSREQLGTLGVELEKLGKKLQELAKEPVKAPGKAADGTTPTPPETVQ
jgi:ABC-type nitrate/sulfonate/bicarbonate transport system substrate-binding protein